MSNGKKEEQLRVIELFAGVGGFRLGLESFEESPYQVVRSDQWEPGTKKQHASMIYKARFGEKGHYCRDIGMVEGQELPEHELMVGGFPCQDYSVANTLSRSGGIVGKKGVLWWEIHRILSQLGRQKPPYLLLENVDRLLKSPAKQRGRDLALMLASLNELGYAVEWQVINAAQYGMPQRRRRVFLMAYHKGSPLYDRFREEGTNPLDGLIPKSFPIEPVSENAFLSFELEKDLKKLSDNFNRGGKNSPFAERGTLIEGKVRTIPVLPAYDGPFMTLGSVLQREEEVPNAYYIGDKEYKKWKYLKGSKREQRRSSSGHTYTYSEGRMVFPDPLDQASRTIITAEGGASPSRFKHVVDNGRGLRRLTPVELERLNMFPDGHTALEGITENQRAFLMGNALVVGIVEKLGKTLFQAIQSEEVLSSP
ncbi:MAG: DNA (cytosine-5-)-methyltransferase [Flavobacteriales bacterium]